MILNSQGHRRLLKINNVDSPRSPRRKNFKSIVLRRNKIERKRVQTSNSFAILFVQRYGIRLEQEHRAIDFHTFQTRHLAPRFDLTRSPPRYTKLQNILRGKLIIFFCKKREIPPIAIFLFEKSAHLHRVTIRRTSPRCTQVHISLISLWDVWSVCSSVFSRSATTGKNIRKSVPNNCALCPCAVVDSPRNRGNPFRNAPV